ncbi:uncharacterized protein LOC119912075 [Micropterus salmoides]|uniref:uncharacterized protein LOC119912075 n=1 Tax=Micropterus salmoides TaxID=27706 RepID=UPI0018EC0330|nr:uncharacterized protein LOC119912075 [Micropterus salmoides]
MMNFTLVTALLFTFSWISVSVSEFHTVEVQPGEEVTLMCSNFSSLPSHINWFRLNNRSNASCISTMMSSDANALFCDGFQNSKFNMTSNTTTLFLKIKQVDLSDSGLYFCGLISNGNSVIVSATYLKVQENPHEKTTPSVILGAVTVFLIIAVTGLAVKISKLQTAEKEEQNPQQSENLDSDDLKDAALTLYSTTIRNRRPASEREVETCVIYAASK